jgi:2-polyprenyl-3-methyl-5-hydroxy-6-metoxy-1,4-benzoquinol methylase
MIGCDTKLARRSWSIASNNTLVIHSEARVSTIKEHYNQRYRGVNENSLPPEDQDTFCDRVRHAIAQIPTRQQNILDYGCGRGGAARRFCDAGHHVEAIDLSDEVIALARRYEPRAKYTVIESEQSLPFSDDAFDHCYSSEVIEHVFDIRAYLSEIHRVVKSGGLLMLTTPYHGVAKNLAIAMRGFERHYDPYHGHIRFFTPKSLYGCLRDHGFEPRTFIGIGRIWPLYKTMYVSAIRM